MYIQTILIILISIILLIVMQRFRKRELAPLQFLFWLMVWVFAGVLVIEPQIPQNIADRIGVGRGVDLVLYCAVLLLFYFAFRIFIKVERLEHHLTTLVRRTALENKEQEGVSSPEKASSPEP